MTQWLAKAAAVLRWQETRDEVVPLDTTVDPRLLFAGDHEWRWAMCHRDGHPVHDTVNAAQHGLQGPFSG